MLQQNEGHTPVIFTVCYQPYDGGTQNDSLLAEVRRDYFTSLRGASGKIRSSATGVELYTRYKIGRGTFQWLKTSGKTVLQKAYPQQNGYYIITWNAAGEMVGKSRYGGDHRWLQTSYYNNGDIARPAVLLKPEQDGGLVLLQFEPEKQKYTQTLLVPCVFHMGTAEQSLVNAVVGEPQIYGETDEGSFCYCTPGEKESRMAVLNDMDPGSLQPDWPEEPDTELIFDYIENDLSALERESEPEPEPILIIQEPPVPEEPKAPDYAADHELYSVDEPVPASPMKYTVAAKGLGGATQVSSAIAPHMERAAKRIVISAEESYLYFGKVIDGLRQGRGRTQMQDGCTAYEGGYINDKRDGFGAYYYKSGKICYVGGWKANKRDGVGVSYSSRDGSIFVGRWKNNIPTGSGAAFDADGNLIYTGEWKNGLRHGHGTEYNNGEIVFSGEFREDKYYTGYQHVEADEKKE